jgi:hypothetical protein
VTDRIKRYRSQIHSMHLPPRLNVVKEIAEHAGKDCKVVQRKGSDQADPILRILHGNNRILFQEGPGSIVVGYVLVTFESVKTGLLKLEKAKKEELLSSLRESLQSSHSFGYRIVPFEISDISDIEYVSIEKEVYLEKADSDSINRFLEVCQGLVSMGRRVQRVFRTSHDVTRTDIPADDVDGPDHAFDVMYQ